MKEVRDFRPSVWATNSGNDTEANSVYLVQQTLTVCRDEISASKLRTRTNSTIFYNSRLVII